VEGFGGRERELIKGELEKSREEKNKRGKM